jgi:hypothetical protein
MHAPPVVLGMVGIAHQHAPEVLQPGEQPFHLPATFVPTKWAAILSFGPSAVRSVGRDQLDPYDSERHGEGIAIIGRITDQPFGALGGKGRSERSWDPGDFMRRSRRRVDGDRKTSAGCHRHELRAFAPLGRSHSQPPFLATAKVPSMKHSPRSSAPRARRSAASASRTLRSVPSRPQGWKRRWQV